MKIFAKQSRRVLRLALLFLTVCLLLCGAALGAIYWHIHRSVREVCALAQDAHPHPADHVAALVDYMNCEEHEIRDRNRSVWTLGRLRDSRALPALQDLYTGQLCDHDNFLCQHELGKAIKRCGGTPVPPPKARHL